MADQEPIEACPFCTCANCKVIGARRFVVQCQGCKAEGPARDTSAEAAQAWRRRPLYDQALKLAAIRAWLLRELMAMRPTTEGELLYDKK